MTLNENWSVTGLVVLLQKLAYIVPSACPDVPVKENVPPAPDADPEVALSPVFPISTPFVKVQTREPMSGCAEPQSIAFGPMVIVNVLQHGIPVLTMIVELHQRRFQK